MIPFLEADWDALSTPERTSLTFLRGLRDAIANDLLAELGCYDWNREELWDDVENPFEWMEWLLTFRLGYHRLGYQRLQARFTNQEESTNCKRLDVLRKIALRIARLERERANVRLDDYDDHLLLNA
jgi:hypothetical protein